MEFTETINPTDFIWLAGLILFARWLLDTSLGRKALADSLPRRNSMPPYLPLVPLLLWFGAVSMTVVTVQKLTPGLHGWQKIFRDHLVMSIGAVVTMAAMMFLAHVHFARGLKGFGLNIKTVAKDFVMAILNLLATWPLMMAAITMTMFVGELIWGHDYQMQPHQQLEMITENPQLPLRIMIVFVAVVIAPLLEEMLFRGFVQTTIRSMLDARYSILDTKYSILVENPESRISSARSMADESREFHPPEVWRTSIQNPESRNNAWPAIAASSVFFAIMHADPGHWPALFVLGLCLGYSYEKSGSLFRPVFIHLLFNAYSVATVLFIET